MRARCIVSDEFYLSSGLWLDVRRGQEQNKSRGCAAMRKSKVGRRRLQVIYAAAPEVRREEI